MPDLHDIAGFMGIRWLIRRDMADILRIESQQFDYPWIEEDFLTVLRQRNCIGMVYEQEGSIAGYMIYELHKERLYLLNFAIDPKFVRSGIGRAMVERLQEKLSMQRRTTINLHIRESNLIGQLFFRAMGFKAVGIEKGFFDDHDEDAYEMRYSIVLKALPGSVRPSIPEDF